MSILPRLRDIILNSYGLAIRNNGKGNKVVLYIYIYICNVCVYVCIYVYIYGYVVLPNKHTEF